MNIFKNENTIINIIKFGPIFFVIIISFFFTQIFLNEKNKSYIQEIKFIENAYIETNKKRVKREINRVFNLIKNEKQKAEELLKLSLQEKVYEAHSIASNLYIKEKDSISEIHNHSEEHVFNTIKYALSGMEYNNGRGYIFIKNANSKNPSAPLTKELIETIKKNGELYHPYIFNKNDDKSERNKRFYFYKYFEPFNIIIGTSEYLKDFEEELKKGLLEKIKNFRDGKTSYIYIFDLKGNTLAHLKDSLIGTNRLKVKNANGKYVVSDIIEFAKKEKSGFLDYSSGVTPDKGLKSNSKISYIRLFDDWNWVIGTGFYLDNLNKYLEETKALSEKRKNEAFNNIIFTALTITLIFIFISFYISRIIANKFKKYRIDIKKEIENTIEKEKLLIQQSKMATMGEMIGNIAHQWKQPLSVISASNGMLKFSKEFDVFTDEEFNDATIAIDDSIKNLSTTIDDFRNFFNPNKKRVSFYLEEAFVKTLKLLSSQFKNNNIELIEDIKRIEIYGLENELLQTLINILKNAKEELVKKERGERRLIFINTEEKENQIKIKIRDNAGGIPDYIIDKVFEAYFTTKEKSGGTGIGLYMSKQIIESMNGELAVNNVEYLYEEIPYKGAEFIITLNL